MRSNLSVLAAAAALAASVSVGASPAAAQGNPERYQLAIQNALTEFEAGHYQEARAFFRQAHREIPNPRTLRGIGMTSYELRDYVDAYRALTRALNFGPTDRDLTAEHRASATQLLERTRLLVGLVHVPPQSQVRVDGESYLVEPGSLIVLPLGTHAIDVALPDGRRGTQTIEIAGGEDVEFSAPISGAGVASQPQTLPQTGRTSPFTPMTPEPAAEPAAEPPPADEPPPDRSLEALEHERPPGAVATTSPTTMMEERPVAPFDEGRPVPRFRLNVLGLAGAGAYQSQYGYYGAFTSGGAVGALVQVADVFAIGAQVAGTYASLFEQNTYSDTAYWGQVDVLAWGELRFGMLALGVGLGAAIGIREHSVFEGGWRYVETRADAAFGLAGDVRLYFADDLLFLAAEGRFAFGDYSAMAGVIAFGVEPLR